MSVCQLGAVQLFGLFFYLIACLFVSSSVGVAVYGYSMSLVRLCVHRSYAICLSVVPFGLLHVVCQPVVGPRRVSSLDT